MKESISSWWGDFTIETGATAEWKIGPLHIAVRRHAHELLVAHQEVEDADLPEWQFAYSDPDLLGGEFSHISRYVFESAPERITVLPALADRPVVSRPFTPLTVPSGEKANIYVGTPLWFTLAEGEPSEVFLEIPIHRPSDTWFGPSTLDGEICYASRTFARLNIENLSPEADWAITRIQIYNNSAAPLPIERLNLPVPYLSVFHTPEDRLCTETVTMVQTRGEAMAEFTVEQGPASTPSGATLIAGPRQAAQKGMLISAFSSLMESGIG